MEKADIWQSSYEEASYPASGYCQIYKDLKVERKRFLLYVCVEVLLAEVSRTSACTIFQINIHILARIELVHLFSHVQTRRVASVVQHISFFRV